MITQTQVKPRVKKQDRLLISLNKQSAIKNRLDSLQIKYNGLELVDIIKLAVVKLDNETPEMDETQWLLNNPAYGQRLVEEIKEIKKGNFKPVTFEFEQFLSEYDQE
jgi:hypothetical protein